MAANSLLTWRQRDLLALASVAPPRRDVTPTAVARSLVARGLARWEGDVLTVTPRGADVLARVRGARWRSVAAQRDRAVWS